MSVLNGINLICVFFSAWIAMNCFRDGLRFWAWFNVFASALNAAALANSVF